MQSAGCWCSFSITLSPLLSLSFVSLTLNHTHHRVISTNLEEVEELSAHNYTSIQTYVSQSQMPSMCEMGVTPLEVSLFVKCARACLKTLATTHTGHSDCNIPPLLIISGMLSVGFYVLCLCKQILPSLRNASINVDGFIIALDSSRCCPLGLFLFHTLHAL